MEKTNKLLNSIKNKTSNALSKRAASFFSNAGNGRNVPVYELINGKSRPKLVDGVLVTEDLTAKINLCKDVNDYKRFLEANNGNLKAAEDYYGKPDANSFFDSTKFGDSHAILNAQAQVKAKFPNENIVSIRQKYEAYIKEMQQKVAELKQEQQKLQTNEVKNEKK